MIGRALASYGDRALLTDARGQLSGEQASAAIEAAADRLQALGVRDGELVAVLPSMSRECLLSLLALWRSGCATFIVPAREPDARLRALIDGQRCRLTISPRALNTSSTEMRPSALFDASDPDLELSGDAPTVTGAATVLATSGSTGAAKLCAHSLDAHLASARHAAGALDLGSDGTWLLNLPLYHVGGLAPVFRALISGAGLALPDADVQPTHLSVVATQLARALDEGDVGHLRRCDAVLVGGGPSSAALRRRAVDAGVPLVVSYGSTETASLITAERDPARLLADGCAGRALPGREVRVSASGEILVRGDSLLTGYLVDGELADPREQGWFPTGDVGHMDSDGSLFVSGRADRMFVSGGENVHPEEIERALLDLNGVSAAVVVDVPDAEYGARPIAFVRTMDRCGGADLRRLLAEQLPSYKIPDAFFELPAERPTEELRRIAADPESFGVQRR